MATFADRLKDALSRRNMTQTDLLNKCAYYEEEIGAKLDRASLSRYLKGTEQPKELRLKLIAKALETDELWLKGFEFSASFSHEELALISAWRQATNEERENVAFMLRKYGMKIEKKVASSSLIVNK